MLKGTVASARSEHTTKTTCRNAPPQYAQMSSSWRKTWVKVGNVAAIPISSTTRTISVKARISCETSPNSLWWLFVIGWFLLFEECIDVRLPNSPLTAELGCWQCPVGNHFVDRVI